MTNIIKRCLIFLIVPVSLLFAIIWRENFIVGITEVKASDDSSAVQSSINTILNTYPDGSYFSKNGNGCGSSSTCSNCKLSNVPSRGACQRGPLRLMFVAMDGNAVPLHDMFFIIFFIFHLKIIRIVSILLSRMQNQGI